MEEMATTDAMPGDMPRRRPPLALARRRELLRFAEELAELVTKRAEPHEMCFLNQAVRLMVERE